MSSARRLLMCRITRSQRHALVALLLCGPAAHAILSTSLTVNDSGDDFVGCRSGAIEADYVFVNPFD